LDQAVEDLLRDRTAIDVVDAGGIEGLRVVADRTTIGSALFRLRQRGDRAGDDEAQGENNADGGASAPPSGVSNSPTTSERGG